MVESCDDLDCLPRKPIILIGGPSGAGKTVLSKQIIAGAYPLLTNLCGGAANEEPLHYDIKFLPEGISRNRILIIECATHKFQRLTRMDQWRRMLRYIHESELIVHLYLDVPRRILLRQYFLRIFIEPEHWYMLFRILQFSKYRHLLLYILTRQLARANAAWRQFGSVLATEMQQRVVKVNVRRTDDDFEMVMNEGASLCSR